MAIFLQSLLLHATERDVILRDRRNIKTGDVDKEINQGLSPTTAGISCLVLFFEMDLDGYIS